MEPRYHIVRGDRREGPFTEEEILDQIDLGQIRGGDLCVTDDDSTPRHIEDIFHVIAPVRKTEPTTALPAREPIEEGDPEPERAYDLEEDDEDSEEEVEEEQTDDERRLHYFGHPSYLCYWKTLLLGCAAVLGGFYGSQFSGWYLFAGVFVGAIAIAYVIIERTTHDYLVTGLRVEVVRGIISKSSREVRIDDIRTINVEKRGLLGLLGIGTVEFASSGTDVVDVAFRDVWAAHRVKRIVRKLQDG